MSYKSNSIRFYLLPTNAAWLFILSTFLISSCTSIVRFSSNKTNQNIVKSDQTGIETGAKFRGLASYYGGEFEGRKTSNGEIFSNDKFTAAHLSLPFGVFVQVTNLKNKKSVIVKINDRGPFVVGRIIDLSRAAAEKLDMVIDGIADIEIEVLGRVNPE
ncbi:MAG: rare lipoprotein [Ignavibacteria bacterium]|nr:rare lipoprotein [Ignavibacteria bacterium]